MIFWKALVSAQDDVSSKRFAGLCLVGQFVICTIVVIIFGDIGESAESLIKAGLYTGGGLLGLGMAKEVLNTVKRDEDK